NAHKIRKIRHLRGARARCMSEKIRAIGAIREIISEGLYRTAIIHKGSKTEKVALGALPNSNNHQYN
ncbi:hypothetical protein, partial [Prevotellamassilia timonensis]|uniref:hypothetical protein n=1 Tax=Prevotellamassilia timonensis TaxID=1852370 RepID=UPI003FF1321B